MSSSASSKTDQPPTAAAAELIRRGKIDEAIDLLRGPGAPHDPRSCVLLARAYHQRGDTRGDLFSAHFFARRAMDLGRDQPEMRAILGLAAFRKEQFEEAAEVLQPLKENGASPAVQHIYGMSLLHAGRVEEARPWLRKAAEAEPDNEVFAEGLQRVDHPPPAKPPSSGRTRRGLGGIADRRPVGAPSPFPFSAVGTMRGLTRAPKDFDWLAKNIPCQAACPAGTDIPGYLSAIYRGDYEEAYRINLRDNVFPAVLGRVCARPCEPACRHGWDGLGEPVAICFSKRSAADFRNQAPVVLEKFFPPSGKRIAVVGAGVAGLAAARDLALMGHAVTVYEKHDRPGGMMNQGIPEFRLPRDHIDREIDQIRLLGVGIVCGTAIGRDLPLDQLLEASDAVVLAAGTLRPNFLDIPGQDLAGIRHGLDFLLEVNDTGTAEVGAHVVVIGGGFTAMDCARTARRLGADTTHLEPADGGEWNVAAAMRARGENVRVAYRRSIKEMLVTPGEVEELGHEGIPMDFMVSPVAYLGSEGRVTHMRFVRTELGEPDASGRRRPVPIEGSEFEVPADTVLLATGQFPDTAWIRGALREALVGEDQWLQSGAADGTAEARIFVAGDFATGAASLIDAIGHARATARKVDAYLMGGERLQDVAVVEDAIETGRIREMDAVPLQPMPMLDLPRRTLRGEVEKGFSPQLAVDETQRCYLCHFKYEIDPDKCIYCDWCIKAKPRPKCIVRVKTFEYAEDGRITGFVEAANTEETQAIWINQEDCIRCNACVDACPVDCISIQKVSRATACAAGPAAGGLLDPFPVRTKGSGASR